MRHRTDLDIYQIVPFALVGARILRRFINSISNQRGDRGAWRERNGERIGVDGNIFQINGGDWTHQLNQSSRYIKWTEHILDLT